LEPINVDGNTTSRRILEEIDSILGGRNSEANEIRNEGNLLCDDDNIIVTVVVSVVIIVVFIIVIFIICSNHHCTTRSRKTQQASNEAHNRSVNREHVGFVGSDVDNGKNEAFDENLVVGLGDGAKEVRPLVAIQQEVAENKDRFLSALVRTLTDEELNILDDEVGAFKRDVKRARAVAGTFGLEENNFTFTRALQSESGARHEELNTALTHSFELTESSGEIDRTKAASEEHVSIDDVVIGVVVGSR